MPNVYQFKDFEGSSHRILIELIRDSGAGGRLLDLGPSNGELGEAVRDQFSHTTCIELDAGCLPALRTRFDDAIIADLQTLSDLPGDYDAIVMADVLEHLHDQRAILDRVRRSIRPGGHLFISVPNIANLTIRLGLLFGFFIYRDRGILDETHVRFYTFSTIRRALEDAGFHVERTRGSSIPLRLIVGHFMSGALLRFAEWLIARMTQLWKALFAYQIIMVARPAEDDRQSLLQRKE
jgi:2-polyprenyl-3-methyl-5-hydroxy-6-metoxy-1,4-benzoquinol methylase